MANWVFLDACSSQHCVYLDVPHISQGSFNNINVSCQMKMGLNHCQGVIMIWKNHPGLNLDAQSAPGAVGILIPLLYPFPDQVIFLKM